MFEEENIHSLYKQNLALSIYASIACFASFILIYLSLIFYKTVFTPITQQSSEPEEKRYRVNLKRQNEASKEIIRNENVNNQQSKFNNLLSEKNSQSTGLELSEIPENPGLKRSSVNQYELKKTNQNESSENLKRQNLTESIFGKKIQDKSDNKKLEKSGQSLQSQMTSKSNNKGAERIGASITLNTYAWNYAPYIEIIRERIYKYISLPSGFYLGLLRGATQAKVVISLEGKKRFIKILDHKGNEILAKTSEDVLHAIFDLPKLPPDFPESELELGIIFLYNVE